VFGGDSVQALVGGLVRHGIDLLGAVCKANGQGPALCPQPLQRTVVEAAAIAQTPAQFIEGQQGSDQKLRLQPVARRRHQGAKSAFGHLGVGAPFAEFQRQPPALDNRHAHPVAGGMQGLHQRCRVDLGADRAKPGDDPGPCVQPGGEEMIHRYARDFAVRGEVGSVGFAAAGEYLFAQRRLLVGEVVHCRCLARPGAWCK
jgi:hypothetical protein